MATNELKGGRAHARDREGSTGHNQERGSIYTFQTKQNGVFKSLESAMSKGKCSGSHAQSLNPLTEILLSRSVSTAN